MAHNSDSQLHAPNMDDIDDDLWRSPSEKDIQSKASKREPLDSGSGGSQVHTGKSKYEDGESKELALRNELENVRKVNDAIEGLIQSLDKAKSSMRVSPLVWRPPIRTNELRRSLSIIPSMRLPLFSTRGHVFYHRPSTING
jgi:hypothetical protein